MLKYYTLFFFIVCQVIFAQPITEKDYISDAIHVSISTGPIFPLGDISNDDASLINPGYAHTGFDIEINFGFMLNKSFDFVTKVTYGFLGTNIDKLRSFIYPQYPTFMVSTLNSGHWNILGILGGISYKSRIYNKLSLENKFYTGFLNYQPREIEFYYSDFFASQPSIGNKFSESSSVQIVFNFSTGLSYKLSKRFAIGFDLDYLYSHPKFYLTKTVYEAGKTTDFKTSFTRNINLVNLNLNIRYSFL